MNQNAISRLESPNRGRPTITTLKRLAETMDVALVVRFVPFSKLTKWLSGTPYIEEGLCTETLAVPKFEDEEMQGAFSDPLGINPINQANASEIGNDASAAAEVPKKNPMSVGYPTPKFAQAGGQVQ